MAARIYLDAGHASKGSDPGAVNKALNLTEANLTTEMRNGVTAAIRKLGFTGKIIHDEDRNSLAAVIKSFQPTNEDILVSFHFNASTKPAATGIEVIVQARPLTAEIDLAAALAIAIKKAFKEGANYEIGLRTQGEFKFQGVISELKSQHSKLGIINLKGYACLVETCFISNPANMAAYAIAKEHIWQAIAEVICKFIA